MIRAHSFQTGNKKINKSIILPRKNHNISTDPKPGEQ